MRCQSNRKSSPAETTMLSHLEALAHALGVQIRYERLESEAAFYAGGLCRIRNKPFIIVSTRATTGEKVQTLARALRRFDLSQVYLRPALRDLLDGFTEEKKQPLRV